MGTYTTVEKCSNAMGLPGTPWRTLTADSGASETDADQINVGATAIKEFPVGAIVVVAEFGTAGDETTITRSEQATVLSVTAGDAFITMTDDLGDDYTTALNAAVHLLSGYSTTTVPSWADVNEMVLEAEDEIDTRCHTTFKAGGKVQDEWFEFKGGRWYAKYPFASTHAYGWGGTQWKTKLRHRNIKTLAIVPTSLPYTGYTGDALTIWTGGEWEEWFNNTNDPFDTSNVDVKTEGRDEDYWINYEEGWLYFNDERPAYGEMQIRMRYRYGDILYNDATTGSAQRSISKACRMLVMIELLSNEQYRVTQPGGEGSGRIDPEIQTSKWEKKVTQLLLPHVEIQMYSDWK